ncbi:MAG TPA: radical SAM protein [Planctomycetota bacterium]|nr:radical SAM protein [Planctomycetota bacterium]
MRGDAFLEQFSARPPFSLLHPRLAAFYRDYLAGERVVEFNGRYVVNSHYPPYPSGAFDSFVGQFRRLGDVAERHIYSLTFAVTNRCPYRCWHCYNAGRSQKDLPLDTLRRVVGEIQALGAVLVTLTGGEPLVRRDLADIAAAIDDRTCVNLNTTGFGLTPERARALHDSGIFAAGFSLDSGDEAEHDRLRGHAGAFRTALDGLRMARDAGLYAYTISVATREFLAPERFWPFVRFAGEAGALEVNLLEPCPSGRLAGQSDVVLTDAERGRILDYQREAAGNEALPIVSCLNYLESADAFGCGAGLTHLYIDGSGEVSPCNLVPLSFGNVGREPLRAILDRMARHFKQPRESCMGRILGPHVPEGDTPTPPDVSARLCDEHLPREHGLPRFFELLLATRDEMDPGAET